MYHASAHQFDFPDYDALVANITNHDNGRLGLWVATTADWIKGFGGHVYTMEISGTVAWRKQDTNLAVRYYQQFLSNGVAQTRQDTLAAERLKQLQRGADSKR